jgi:hypothetical protein
VPGPLGRVSLLGTLEDMLRKAPDRGMSLRRGPLCPRGTWNQGGGGCVPGTLNDEWRRALGMGHLSVRGHHEGDLEGGLLD